MRRVTFVLLTLALTSVGGPLDAQQAQPATAEAREAREARTPRTVRSWINQLEGGNRDQQLEAILELAAMRGRAAEAVPQLASALQSTDQEIQQRAAMALGAIGSQAADASPALAQLLESPDATVRAYAADALGRIGVSSDAILDALANSLEDDDVVVRRQAREALRQIKAPRERTLPLMMKILQEAAPSEVMPALQYFADAGEDAVPSLIDALQHPRAAYWACLVLQDIGPAAKEATPYLLKVLNHEEPTVRMQAALALAALQADAEEVVDALAELLRDEQQPGAVRYAGIYALGRLGKGNTDAVSLLHAEFKSEDPVTQVVSAWALLHLVPDNEEVRNAAYTKIVSGLESEDEAIRRAAIRAMVQLDLPAKAPAEGVDALVRAAREVDPIVIEQVISGLAQRGEEVVPRLKTGLENESLRPYTLDVIQRMGEVAKPLVPQLSAMLESESDPRMTREIHFALGAIGSEAASAVPRLVDNLDSEHAQVRYSACYALGKIGTPAASAADRLRALWDSEDAFLRLASIWAVLRIAPTSEHQRKAVPLLADLLQDDREMVRVEAAAALGDLKDKRAVTALEAAAQDPSRAVRDAVQKALADIGA